jgi:diguanylate cyclase (GGDEF)-like protein
VLIEKGIRQQRMKKENERLQEELQAMLEQLKVKNVQLQESLDKLETMAATDHLTGLPNRRRLGDLLQRYYGEAVRYGFDLTCCMCDLDEYKQINDTLGHLIGDELLVLAAEVITSSLRSSDVAARYGGDEFVLLLPHTSLDRGCAVGERIRKELAVRSAGHEKLSRAVTVSMGVASVRCDSPDSADQLVALADRALYVAKETGRNRIVTFREAREAETPA